MPPSLPCRCARAKPCRSLPAGRFPELRVVAGRNLAAENEAPGALELHERRGLLEQLQRGEAGAEEGGLEVRVAAQALRVGLLAVGVGDAHGAAFGELVRLAPLREL